MINKTKDGYFEVLFDGEMIARLPDEDDANRILQYVQLNGMENWRKLIMASVDGWKLQDAPTISLTDGPIITSVEFPVQSPDSDIELEEALEVDFNVFVDQAHTEAVKLGMSPQQANEAILSLLVNRMRADRANDQVNQKISTPELN